MSLGTKNRQIQIAETCKQHLRDKYRDKLALVDEFIAEFEGTGKNQDRTKWDSVYGCELDDRENAGTAG